jgi:hypothetical protein
MTWWTSRAPRGKQILDVVMTRKGAPALKEDVTVDVRDGELTMTVGGHLTNKKGNFGMSSTRINYLVIKKASK